MILRLGSRGSRLALAQAELAADRLRGADPAVEVALELTRRVRLALADDHVEIRSDRREDG